MILITGSAGYIGSHLQRFLFNKNEKCVGLDNLSNSTIDCSCVITRVGDLLNIEDIREVFNQHQNIDCVIHLADLNDIKNSIDNKQDYMDVNLTGTENLLKVMKEFSCNKIIFTSTSTVYDNCIITSIPITDNPKSAPVSYKKVFTKIKETGVQKLIDNYSFTKLLAERLIEHNQDLRYSILRLSEVIGYEDWYNLEKEFDKNKVMSSLISSIQYNKAFKIDGNLYYPNSRKNPADHTLVKDYVDVRDVCNAIYLAYKYLDIHSHSIFNISSSKDYSLLEVLEIFNNVNNTNIKYIIDKPINSYKSFLVLDTTKAKELLRWKLDYSIEDSLKIV